MAPKMCPVAHCHVISGNCRSRSTGQFRGRFIANDRSADLNWIHRLRLLVHSSVGESPIANRTKCGEGMVLVVRKRRIDGRGVILSRPILYEIRDVHYRLSPRVRGTVTSAQLSSRNPPENIPSGRKTHTDPRPVTPLNKHR